MKWKVPTKAANPHRAGRRKVKAKSTRAASHTSSSSPSRSRAKRIVKAKKTASKRAAKRVMRVKSKRTQRPNGLGTLITLGSINPAPSAKRRKQVRKSKTKSTARKARTVKGVSSMKKATKKAKKVRKNTTATAIVKRKKTRRVARKRTAAAKPTVKVVYRSKPKSKRKSKRTARRTSGNPATILGQGLMSVGGLKVIGGGLAGVVAARTIPGLVARFITLPSNPWLRPLYALGSAWIASLGVSKLMPGPASEAVLFGGAMEAGSQVLNVLQLNRLGSVPLTLNGQPGMGVFHPASFPMPQQPVIDTGAAPAMNPLQRVAGAGPAPVAGFGGFAGSGF